MSFYILVLGLVVGSFLNVCIYRLPRRQSLFLPPSRCPYCEGRLAWRDLVPLVSYVLLRGRCRFCGIPISRRYPLVELLTGLIYLILFRRFGEQPILWQWFILAGILIVITFTDLEQMCIPNQMIVFGLLVGLVLNVLIGALSLRDTILGMVAGGGVLYLILLLSGGGMGGGDVKLGAVTGLFLGWQQVLLALFLAACGAALVGLLGIITGRKQSKDPIPFGPFIALGTFIVLFWGPALVNGYLRCFLKSVL